MTTSQRGNRRARRRALATRPQRAWRPRAAPLPQAGESLASPSCTVQYAVGATVGRGGRLAADEDLRPALREERARSRRGSLAHEPPEVRGRLRVCAEEFARVAHEQLLEAAGLRGGAPAVTGMFLRALSIT